MQPLATEHAQVVLHAPELALCELLLIDGGKICTCEAAAMGSLARLRLAVLGARPTCLFL